MDQRQEAPPWRPLLLDIGRARAEIHRGHVESGASRSPIWTLAIWSFRESRGDPACVRISMAVNRQGPCMEQQGAEGNAFTPCADLKRQSLSSHRCSRRVRSTGPPGRPGRYDPLALAVTECQALCFVPTVGAVHQAFRQSHCPTLGSADLSRHGGVH